MGVGGSEKKIFARPYSIISLITIWSFLFTTIFAQACPYYLPKAISPPSRFSPIIDIPRLEKEASFAYINFYIGKNLRTNDTIIELNENLKKYNSPWRFHAEKIPKANGVYLIYQNKPKDAPRILHYFLKEKDAHTDRYKTMEQGYDRPFFVEPIAKQMYEKLRNNVRVFFAPGGGCGKEIVDSIDAAEKTIDAAAHNFTNKDIFEALKRAGQRGVRARLFMIGRPQDNALAKDLESYSVKVKYYYKKCSLMDEKFMIVDREKVLTGSYDWNNEEEKMGRENLSILPYMDDFQYEFESLWNLSRTRPLPDVKKVPLYKDTMQALFFPKNRCEDKITALIRLAAAQKRISPKEDKTIYIALYYFTNPDIADALFDAKESGVDIELLLDESQKGRSNSMVKYFHKLQKRSKNNQSSIEIAYYRIPGCLANNKFAAIGNFTVMGSYNWARPAENKNIETVVIIPQVLTDCLDEFYRLWKESCGKDIIGNNAIPVAGGSAPPKPSPKPPPDIFGVQEVPHAPHAHMHISHHSHKKDDDEE